MFEVKRQYWSCMGETVLKKSQFDQDVANTRAMNRVLIDQMDLATMKAIQAQQQPVAQPGVPRFLQPIIQRGIQLLQPLINTATNVARAIFVQIPSFIAQSAQALANRAEKAVSQILSFFFGHKKEKTEEKEQRDKNEFAMVGLFGDSKVEETAETDLGGGN